MSGHAQKRYSGRIILMAFLLMIGGCGTSDPSRFYVLKPAGWESQPAATADTLRIGLHAFTFPEYLLRSEIVTLQEGNRIDLAEYDRWAEGLEVSFMRVLAINLTHMVPGGMVHRYPWRREPGIDVELEGEVLWFGREGDGQVHLVVDWALRREGSVAPGRRRFVFAQLPAAEGIGETVKTMNEGVTALSREIAAEIKEGLVRFVE